MDGLDHTSFEPQATNTHASFLQYITVVYGKCLVQPSNPQQSNTVSNPQPLLRQEAASAQWRLYPARRAPLTARLHRPMQSEKEWRKGTDKGSGRGRQPPGICPGWLAIGAGVADSEAVFPRSTTGLASPLLSSLLDLGLLCCGARPASCHIRRPATSMSRRRGIGSPLISPVSQIRPILPLAPGIRCPVGVDIRMASRLGPGLVGPVRPSSPTACSSSSPSLGPSLGPGSQPRYRASCPPPPALAAVLVDTDRCFPCSLTPNCLVQSHLQPQPDCTHQHPQLLPGKTQSQLASWLSCSLTYEQSPVCPSQITPFILSMSLAPSWVLYLSVCEAALARVRFCTSPLAAPPRSDSTIPGTQDTL